jgi:ATP-dependent Clp protease protease subunit
VRAQVEEVLSHHTGRSVDQLRLDTDRDKVLTAQQAVEFGIVDHVIERATEVAPVGA